MLALLFLLINVPLLVSTKVVSRQDLSTKLLRDWRIVSISDEVANHLDILGLFNGIKDHKFDEHELLALTEDLPLSAQIGNAHTMPKIFKIYICLLKWQMSCQRSLQRVSYRSVRE